jgi:hypothetical protein
MPAEPPEQLADARIVLLEQLVPAAVSELAGALRRADDVGEQNRREETVLRLRGSHAGQELLELGEHRLDVPDPERVVFAVQLD